MINNPIIYKFFKDVTNRRKNTKRVEVLAVDLSQYSEIHGTINETFKQSGNQDSFRLILKSSAGMYKSPGPQFFRTTIGVSHPEEILRQRFQLGVQFPFLNTCKIF